MAARGSGGGAFRTIESAARTIVGRSVLLDGNCWEWQGNKVQGYGRVWVGSRTDGSRRSTYAHRVTFQAFVGEVPAGMDLDHLCRNRACCNPWHLEPVSPRENTMRSPIARAAVNARKTHCNRGHPLSGPNLERGSRGERRCRECYLAARRAHYYRARARQLGGQ